MPKKEKIESIDLKLISFLRGIVEPSTRIALFIVFFWFGIIKLLGASPASPLAESLAAKTIGIQYFDFLFMLLAVIECSIGILFLFKKATRLVIPLLFAHMAVVCAPLILLPEVVWDGFLVPTLEGQYIIKNVVVVAAAIGIAALMTPIKSRKANDLQ